MVITRHIKNGTEKETPWCWCHCFSANKIHSPIRIDPKQVPKYYKSTEVGDLPSCFKSDSDENLELPALEKHFKVEKEGYPDLFYDAVAVNGNEEPEAPPLPAVIDDEVKVMGRNHGGANELAAALNGVVDIDDDNEPTPENHPGQVDDTTFTIASEWGHRGICYHRQQNIPNSKAKMTNSVNEARSDVYLQLFKHFFPKNFIKTEQENVCSEPHESLSYSLFQSHFQGSSTPNTQKIFLPKPIWEKLSKDQQQMIIDHNRSLPKSGSTHLSTPNKSLSPLPHKPTPQQTAKSQQVHTHQSDEGTTDTTKTETTPSDPLLAMVHQSIHTSDDDASDISNVLSVKRSCQIQVCQRYLFQHANHTNQQLVDRGANGGLAGSDMRVIHKPHRKINIQGIDNH